MWVITAFISTLFLGIYDVSKKMALKKNAILPVLVISTGISALLFSPILISSTFGLNWFGDSFLSIPREDFQVHIHIIVKSFIVMLSWICGYYGLKSTPLSIYGPISATRPVFVLLGAIVIFDERLNMLQWGGVIISIFSIYLLGRSSKKTEGIDFKRNKAIFFVMAATIFGAASALYDRYILTFLNPVFSQGWFTLYEFILMCLAAAIIRFPHRKETETFHWSWAIPVIAAALSIADFAYFQALSDPKAMISMVSMIRRGSVVISFLSAAIIFHEKNIRSKSIDLGMIVIGMILLYLGSR